jgi:hypothetical protein
MVRVDPLKALLLFAMAALGPPAWAQTPVDPKSAHIVLVDPTKLHSPTPLSALPPGKASPLKARPRTAPRAPLRLANAEYLQLRPHLASLFKVSEARLPPAIRDATNLVTIGGTVNVKVCRKPPSGFNWRGVGVSVFLDDQGPVTEGLLFFEGEIEPGPQPSVGFQAVGAPAGLYLLTVYLDCPDSTVNCRLSADTETYSKFAVQHGMVMVPVSLSHSRDIVLDLDFGPKVNILVPRMVYSCDFTRIQ